MVHHGEDGAFGLVINRPAGLTASDLCESLDLVWNGDPVASVGSGGPVQPNTGWVLFGDGASNDLPESKELDLGVYFAGSIETLRGIATAPPDRVRLFLGYAGWGPGQLEQELSQGAWLLIPGSLELVFDVPDDDIWDRALRGLGIDPATLIATPGIH